MRSRSEVKVGKALEKKGLVVRYQHKIGNYFLDIYLPQLEVSVETHGPHHVIAKRIQKDEVRSRFIGECGISEYIIYANDANIPGRVRDLVQQITAENSRVKLNRRQPFNTDLAMELKKYKKAICT